MAPPLGHRPGLLKQQNKVHNSGRHRSKGAVRAVNKGKVKQKPVVKKVRREMSKLDRINKAKQRRALKEELKSDRILGSSRGPPVAVCIVSLSPLVDSDEILQRLVGCNPDSHVHLSDRGFTFLSVPKLNSRFSFVCPPFDDLLFALDAAKAADLVLFLWDGDNLVPNDYCCNLLSAMLAQGMPSHYNVLINPFERRGKLDEKPRRLLEALAEKWALSGRIVKLETSTEQCTLLRLMANCAKKPIALHEHRCRILVDHISVADGGVETENSTNCTALFHGYIRGRSLDVNRLIHITGWGDFRMSAIDVLIDPHPLIQYGNDSIAEHGVQRFAVANAALQESLENEVVVDEMNAEQTWPTEAELRLANEEIKKRLVPKGTSQYQAAWIVDDVDDEMDEDEQRSQWDPEEMDLVSETDNCTELDITGYDEKEEHEELMRIRREREDKMFPDEVDTPGHVPARVRFQRYRGLKSFRTSRWDPMENLPTDYARIFRFQNFAVAKKRVLEESDSGALHGWYVAIHVPDVPKAAVQSMMSNKTRPLLLYGLLPYEQKMSVVNVLLRKSALCNKSFRSKDELLFCVGFRRYFVSALFSQHTNGNKHKLERFLPEANTVVASFYAPITFPPAGVSAFSVDSDGSLSLVATGNLLDTNPNRIVIKRVVLSGHPFKINKRHAVLRYMFFNREDVDWFKPVELRTRSGRRGRIIEALGTHGHMKCVFNAQLPSQDVVFLDLYKRQFPKWTYDPNADGRLNELHEKHLEPMQA